MSRPYHAAASLTTVLAVLLLHSSHLEGVAKPRSQMGGRHLYRIDLDGSIANGRAGPLQQAPDDEHGHMLRRCRQRNADEEDEAANAHDWDSAKAAEHRLIVIGSSTPGSARLCFWDLMQVRLGWQLLSKIGALHERQRKGTGSQTGRRCCVLLLPLQ